MTEFGIAEVTSVECKLVSADWDFAVREAEAIEEHWRARKARTPELFNGPVLLLRDGQVEARVSSGAQFRGSCFETEFKSFLAWREFGYPASSARNIFSMAAIETADEAFLLGEMAPHTAPAGQIYFPSGTPDLGDVKEGLVDIDGSAARELREETGLQSDDVAFAPGMDLVLDQFRVCCMKRVLSPESASSLVTRIHAWLARDSKPELARMHIVRTTADIQPAMPDFIVRYLRYRLERS